MVVHIAQLLQVPVLMMLLAAGVTAHGRETASDNAGQPVPAGHEAASSAQPGDSPGIAEAVTRALQLLPGTVAPVVLIDPELAPDSQAVAGLDAFVVREPDGTMRRRIYLNARSTLLTTAARGAPLAVAMLAAVIHHEARHLDGGTELDARAAERELFASFVRKGIVTEVEAARVLDALDQQPVPASHGVAALAAPRATPR